MFHSYQKKKKKVQDLFSFIPSSGNVPDIEVGWHFFRRFLRVHWDQMPFLVDSLPWPMYGLWSGQKLVELCHGHIKYHAQENDHAFGGKLNQLNIALMIQIWVQSSNSQAPLGLRTVWCWLTVLTILVLRKCAMEELIAPPAECLPRWSNPGPFWGSASHLVTLGLHLVITYWDGSKETVLENRDEKHCLSWLTGEVCHTHRVQ